MFQLSSIVVGFFFAIFCVSTWKLFLVAGSLPSIEEKIQDNETRLNGLYDLLTRDYEEVKREIDTKIEKTKREIDGIYNTLVQDDIEILRQMNGKIDALTENVQGWDGEIDYLYQRVDDMNSEMNSLHDRLDALDQAWYHDELSGNPEQV